MKPTKEDCQPLPSLKRNNYFYGKLLTAEDFRTEQEYLINKQRLINRLVHGSGIVCGLEVTRGISESVIQVSEGFTLDGLGREVVLNNRLAIDLNQKINPKEVGRKRDLFVTIRYFETKVDPVPKIGESEKEFNMILEGAKVDVDLVLPDPFSKDTLFLAKVTAKTRRKKICVEKVEDSATVNDSTLTRAVIRKKELIKQ